MGKFKDMLATVLVYMGVIVLLVFAGGSMLVGGLAIFGSMFFEVTFAQLTFLIVLQHIGIFFGGAFLIAISLTILKWIAEKL